MLERRLVDVRGDQLVGLGDGEARIEVFAIDQRDERAGLDLVRGDQAVFMPGVVHAVALVLPRRRGVVLRLDGRIVGNGLDLEIDVTDGHGCLLSM
jgi:hypothetical protein